MAAQLSILNDQDYGRRPNFFTYGNTKKFGNISMRLVEDPATDQTVVYMMKESSDMYPNSYLRFTEETVESVKDTLEEILDDIDSTEYDKDIKLVEVSKKTPNNAPANDIEYWRHEPTINAGGIMIKVLRMPDGPYYVKMMETIVKDDGIIRVGPIATLFISQVKWMLHGLESVLNEHKKKKQTFFVASNLKCTPSTAAARKEAEKNNNVEMESQSTVHDIYSDSDTDEKAC